jgi:hypothetical protein
MLSLDLTLANFLIAHTAARGSQRGCGMCSVMSGFPRFGAAVDIAERARLNLTENRTLGHEGRLSDRQRTFEGAPLNVGFVPTADIDRTEQASSVTDLRRRP